MKSHVAMEQRVCVVCGERYDTGSILLDKRLRERLDSPGQVVGQGVCPTHQAQIDAGYIHCIEHDGQRVVSIRAERWYDIFNAQTPVPPRGVCYIPEEVADFLEGLISTTDQGADHDHCNS